MRIEQLYSCHFWEIPSKVIENLHLLLQKLERLEEEYGAKFEVSSGFRSNQEHARIYKTKNEARKKLGLAEIPPPLHSKHLTGEAADLKDPHGYIKAWIERNLDVIKEIDLYFEDFAYTDGFVHVQVVPPQSKKRFFKPY